MKNTFKKIVTLALALLFIMLPILSTNTYASGFFYTVKNGDSLWKIANRNGLTIERLKRENNYWSNTIYPGQKLYISASELKEYDRYLLAKTVYAEARGEVFEGQVAVAAVILNRVNDKDFPNSVHGVVYEPLAFTAVADGQINLEPNSTAYKAVDLAIKGWDTSEGALFYFNPDTSTSSWIWSRPQIKKIGNHIFAK